MPVPHRAKVLLDGAYHAGFRRRDAGAARSLLEEARPLTMQDAQDGAMLVSMTLRAEAAALLAEGKPDEARAKARDSLASLAARASGVSDRCLLDRLAATCDWE